MKKIIFILLLSATHLCKAQTILPLRQQAAKADSLLLDRFQNLLPALMQKHRIDMWIIVGREYAEDPVMRTMLPATWLHARRRTILIFYNGSNGLERLAVARYDVGNLFKGVWNPEQQPAQWQRLAEVVKVRKPRTIGINISGTFAHADGLTKTESDSLFGYLGSYNLASAEPLAVDWLQLRTAAELRLYEDMCALTHHIIKECFSGAVVKPGVTTTEDLVWWLRDKVQSLGLQTWFHPTVDVQRSTKGEGDTNRSFASRPGETVIQSGDLLHCDFGISYLGLHTDMQQLAYVLKPGEKEAPAYLKKALATGNRLQDLLTKEFRGGRTGNQVLKATIAAAKAEGIEPSIYSHPIGYHGHAAGPAIGMWDMQAGVPGSGDQVLLYNTCYAIELNAKVPIKEWNKDIRVMLEEQGLFTADGVRYVHGRQKELLLVGADVNNYLGQ